MHSRGGFVLLERVYMVKLLAEGDGAKLKAHYGDRPVKRTGQERGWSDGLGGQWKNAVT